MEFLNRNFSQDWQHLRESDVGPDLSGIEQGNRRSRVLTPEMLSDRSSSDLISQRYNHPTNRIVRYPSRSPKNFTTAVPCQQPLSRLTPKSSVFSHPYPLVTLKNSLNFLCPEQIIIFVVFISQRYNYHCRNHTNEMKSGRGNAMKKIRCYACISVLQGIIQILENTTSIVNYVINLHEKLRIYLFVVGLVLTAVRLATKIADFVIR